MIHSRTNAKVLFHTDGSIIKLLPDLIEIGVDFINPVQVSAKDMDDTAHLKQEYGNEIGFWGGIDNLQVLPNGTPDDVRAEVKRRVEDLGSNGGYVLAAVHNIQPDVPPENVAALFDAVGSL
jgi:uroporphyrinogen decarboxylase